MTSIVGYNTYRYITSAGPTTAVLYTAGGLNTIKDIVSKTKVDAVPLRDSIKQLQASFGNLSAALSPVLPGAEKK